MPQCQAKTPGHHHRRHYPHAGPVHNPELRAGTEARDQSVPTAQSPPAMAQIRPAEHGRWSRVVDGAHGVYGGRHSGARPGEGPATPRSQNNGGCGAPVGGTATIWTIPGAATRPRNTPTLRRAADKTFLACNTGGRWPGQPRPWRQAATSISSSANNGTPYQQGTRRPAPCVTRSREHLASPTREQQGGEYCRPPALGHRSCQPTVVLGGTASLLHTQLDASTGKDGAREL